jgi:hypothetical protein
MKVTPEQADRFYAAWWPLLSYVNDERHIVPGRMVAPLKVELALALRDALWADNSLLETFVTRNPAGLSAEQLAMVASWEHRVAGMFVVWKHFKKHSILLHGHDAFAVLGLHSTLEEILPMPPPLMVDAVLLPFEGVIVTDGLINAKNIVLGPGIRRGLKQEYDDTVERGAVQTSLLPSAPGAEAKPPADRRATNRKVLSALRRYLYGDRRLQEATVERDLQVIAGFAEGLPEGRSLREFTLDDVEATVALAATLFGGRAQTVAALKRFVAFMLNTERIDPGPGEEVLDWLRRRGTKP